MTTLPTGFRSYVANVGIKDETDDLVVVAADQLSAADGVFTTSRFAGPSVTISREHLADRSARAIVVVSKNANVANGAIGLDHAKQLVAGVADRLGCRSTDVVVASTGVIGRPYPMERLHTGIAAIPDEFGGRRRLGRPRCPRHHDHRHGAQDRRGDHR